HRSEITDLFDKDVRIQIAVLSVCYIALYFATVLYRRICNENAVFNDEVERQKEELFQQAEELEALNGELNRYSEDLLVKNDQLKEMAMQTIMTIANTIDAKDEYTRGHSRRVSEYSAAIAAEMGFSEEELRDIRFTGLLHDIGKIGVPDNVLNKPGRLTSEEYQLMKDHTVTGGEILKDITMIKDLDIGAKYHHEHYDGTGYPEGLRGDEIPLTARIIGVADAYDAMTSNRVYRRHLPQDKVIEELKKGNGTQFDPKACSILLRLIEENRLPGFNPDDESIEVKQATQILTRVIDKAEEAALEDMQLDELTGTLSREHGMKVIQNEIGKHGTGSIFAFDIDNFRRVNEKKGFVTGDRYLSRAAEEIKSLVKDITVCRFGSDEFIAYLPDADSEEDAVRMAEKYIAAIRDISLNDPSYSMLSVSIGITPVSTEKDRIMVLYENASKALFVAKQYGEGSFFYHGLDMSEEDDVAVANSADLRYIVDCINSPDKESLQESFPEAYAVSEAARELMKENGDDIYITLFTLRLKDGDQLNTVSRTELMDILERSIGKHLEKCCVALKYSNLQHVLLIGGLDEGGVRQTINKITADFYRVNTAREVEVHYDTAELAKPLLFEAGKV
ncbi:MAG TPA: hypothetical protein DCL38_03655, partial [Lachnospiraceae bacterium]|nr:hypothetical protein [Lachnospiraceae bacterium]